jgi:hypothetical protein
MRVVTIAIAGVIISSEVRPDSEGGYQWIVHVAERTGITARFWSRGEHAAPFRGAMRWTWPL